MYAGAQQAGAAASIRVRDAGSSSSDSEGYGYPSTLCPAISFEDRDLNIDIYGGAEDSQCHVEDVHFNRTIS
jgi:hypothetical protein